MRSFAGLSALLLLAAAPAGCGGGSTSAPSAATTSAGRASSSARPNALRRFAARSGRPAAAALPRLRRAAGNARSFIVPGGDNSIQTYGREASAPQRARAGAVLKRYLTAYAAGDWPGACAQMSVQLKGSLQRLARSTGKTSASGCAPALRAFSAAAPAAARRVGLPISAVAALRVEGEQGFALYHSAHGSGYFAPMLREAGRWRVASLGPTEIAQGHPGAG
jgi:hypothetical protein